MATFEKVAGRTESKKYTLAGTVVAGSIVQGDEANGVVVHATNKSALGIALEGGTSGQSILVEHLFPDSKVKATGVTATIVAGSVFQHVDVSAGTDITLTDTNKDALVIGWYGAATSALLTFKKIVFGSSTLE